MNNYINIAMVIEYEGSRFFGFQKQLSGVRTVQGELEKALTQFAGHAINVITAGRTDAGVHALFQVINFTTTIKRELYSWQRGPNSFLPSDIVIREVVNVPPEFNARHAAISRTYHYYLSGNRIRPAMMAQRVGFCYSQCDLDFISMREAGQYLLGMQDFSSFRASECQARNPVRNLTHFDLVKINKDVMRFEFTANAFLYHMVRNIVGALIFVGKHKLSVSGFGDLINAKNRYLAPPTFMPDGLYLTGVGYKESYFSYTPFPLYSI